jgi:hypothetical protein
MRTLKWVRHEFKECASCAAKSGSPVLCHECLERRELYGLLEELRRLPERQVLMSGFRTMLTVCPDCGGEPNPYCKEHGR